MRDLPVQVRPHLAGEPPPWLLFLLLVFTPFQGGCSVEPQKDTSLGDLKMPKGVTFHTRNALFLRKIPAVTVAGTTDHLHPPIFQANRTHILFRVGPSLIPGTSHDRSPCSPVSDWLSGEM